MSQIIIRNYPKDYKKQLLAQKIKTCKLLSCLWVNYIVRLSESRNNKIKVIVIVEDLFALGNIFS